MKVKNINGTTDNTCRCGTWIDHWKNYSSQALSKYCSEEQCPEKPEVGAHVQKDNSSDSSWYIVPLCKKHNGETNKSIDIGNVELVDANVSQTCGGN